MLFVDDLSVIFVIQRGFAKLLTDLFLDLFQKRILHFSVTVNVVRCYASLSAVQIFAEYNTFGGKLDICRFIYNAWAFSPKLQGDWSEVLAGMAHDLFSNSLAAGEKDVVKVLLEKAGVFLASTHNNGHILFRKTFTDDLADDIAGGRRVGAGF